MRKLVEFATPKRLGNLRGGEEEIQQQKWFSTVDFEHYLAKQVFMHACLGVYACVGVCGVRVCACACASVHTCVYYISEMGSGLARIRVVCPLHRRNCRFIHLGCLLHSFFRPE